ncbi:molybdopterin cofactor-binding domain-containing protein [uncultured Flavobacterium sp.]|uniref:molybdopterin cofactor-binding domain-containing protein n=1 Tax=uncultured Flavobacterium sp. TaxID=165435 RepID=UPI0025E724A4|nr:molybdopterin cofactor-binding domain-containing protein [uncultured Flavobacterium sp.]
MKNKVNFFLNGKPAVIENPSPDLLLIDYLRSPEVGLCGPKKPCGQGGCGGCTVILSQWDSKEKKTSHLAINSCLRPVCAIEGLSITTIEGTGAARKPDPEHFVQKTSSTRMAAPLGEDYSPVLDEAEKKADEKRIAVFENIAKNTQDGSCTAEIELVKKVSNFPSEETHSGINPVAYQLALNNGSQCGYCSVGFVMNMSEFIINNKNATKKEIEQAFDGNLCRCTGYRSILTGMKTFASDWDSADEKKRMSCTLDPVGKAQLPGKLEIPFPKEAEHSPKGISINRWTAPATLEELGKILNENEDVRLVHANTSYGIYKNEYLPKTQYVDIRFIPELNEKSEIVNDHFQLSASTTYSDLIELLSKEIGDSVGSQNKSKLNITALEALDYMARRTAGRIVRNAATIGGNTMLVLKHIPKDTGEPFPSDLFTTLYALETKISYYLEKNGQFKAYTKTAEELLQAIIGEPKLADQIVLKSYEIPVKKSNAIVFAQKVALREVNSHSIVNATTNFNINDECIIESAVITLGGIAPYPWRAAKTEAAMLNKKLELEDVNSLSIILAEEVRQKLEEVEARMEEVPDEGFTPEYRTQLAVSFFYKSIINALVAKGVKIPENLISASENKWGHWPVSDGVQNYKTQNYKAPVAQPYIKVTAMYQTSGQIHYTHELPVPPQTLNGAFVQSRKALKNYFFSINGKKVKIEELRMHLKKEYPSFTDIITHENIKNGARNFQGMGNDQPLFAEELVNYVGQSIAMVLAANEQEAIKIAAEVSEKYVSYTKPGSPYTGDWSEPIFDFLEAITKGSIFPDAPTSTPFISHIWKITRPGSQFDWTKEQPDQPKTLLRKEKQSITQREEKVDNIPCTVVNSSQLCGGQAHFYMEPQACIATPIDEGRIKVQPSVQSPGGMHDTVASALAMYHHQVEVNVPPVGGGFGGKTEQTRFVAGPAAVAAKAVKKPVRIAMPRDEDTAMIGKRHAYYGEYEIAVDTGEAKPENKGIIHGFQLKMWGDGGAFYDCSFIVSNCVQLRTDNAYRIKNFESQIDVCRTNTAPGTAMRAFGDVQGKNIVENAIDDAAISIGMRPEDLREKNLYDRGDVTPFGQALTYCYMKQVWAYAKDVSNFEAKYKQVQDFNKENKWFKRGISIIPVKYGSGYNLLALEQSAAIVAINPGDGTVVIHQGGVEIGQGLVTQAQQVASYVLGIPMEMIFIDNVNTSITPNPTSTGGSTGTPYSCEAVKQTCEEMRARLMEFGYQMLNENGEDWCIKRNIDFWNYGAGENKGWATKINPNEGNKSMIWQNLISLAASQRVNLIASFNAKIKGGEVQIPVMTFKPESDQPNIPGIERIKNASLGGGVDSFVGFTYSVAVSVTEVDILTGEVKIISSDIIYDMGWSLNPAIDIGQIEGAFVQGIGYLLTEKLVSETKGPDQGRLNSTNTWRYKIPAITTIPLEMNTFLFPRDEKSVESIPPDPNQIFSAKEVGEPPLVLANSVFFAIKDAIRASRVERGLSPLFRLDAPATVQEVRRACEITEKNLINK